uniref:DNA glycosylase/AP lyase ROS1-like n=1 Tax=Erigeron canadensis TaxID=72917 RepID=UPI001CB90E1F|nr:DNA glycosylase/AP lyase ROS1-like [Erigeron canadensis]
MDREEESSCSHQEKSDSNTTGKNWLGTPFNEPIYEETSMRESNLGSTSQMIDFNIGIHDKLSMYDGDTWHNEVSFKDLLAMASIGKFGITGDAIGRPQYGKVDYATYLSDPHLSPQTVNDPYVSTGLSLGFTPVTPNQGGRAEQHKQVESEAANSNENERMNLNLAADKEKENLDEHSQADVSTLASVNEDMEKGSTEQTNLNETPQQKQRRRKHRPKVVIEGQRKRARKPATPKPETPNPGPTSTGKRKYVRRKGIEKPSETPTEGDVSGTVDPSTSTNQQTKKRRNRKINFDEPEQQTEVTDEKTQLEHMADKTTCSAPQKPKTPKPGATSRGKRKYVRKKGIEKSTETPTVGEASGTVNPSTSTDQQTKKTCKRKINFDEPEKRTEVTAEKTQVEHMVHKTTSSTSEVVEISQKVLTSESPSPITPSKTELPRGVSRKSTKATCKINFLQETHDKGESSLPSPNESNCSTSACLDKGKEAQGSNEGLIRNMDGVTLINGNALGISDEETYLSMFTNYNSGSNAIHLSAIGKKKRVRKKQMIATTSASKAPEMPIENGVCMQNSRNKKTTAFRMVHDTVASAGMINDRYQKPTYMETHSTEFQLSLVTNRNSLVPPFYHYPQYFTNHTGSNPSLRCTSTYGIEKLIRLFGQLNINRPVAEKYRNTVIPYMPGYNEKNALVVFQRDGTLVPYIKKRKTRPKVDLDDETTRVWKLLLENINSEGIDGTDEAKEKWWEEERKVFRGRAESFISRMHLVQGDRRFSKWKGSVLDSVVGVFLTQNVSDHLSSSAFMSLAARYPLKSKRSSETSHEEESIMSVKEPCQEDEDRGSMMMQNADPCEEKEVVNSNEPSQNSVINFDLNDNSECEVLEIPEKGSAVYKESVLDQREFGDIHSSQDSAHTSPSSQSSIVNNSERLGSSFVHNSREQKDGSKSTALDGYTSFVEMLHKQGPTTVNETYSQQLAEDSSEQTLSAKEHELPNTCTLEALAFESFEVREERKLIQAQNKKSASAESRLKESRVSAESANQTAVQMVKSISSQESVKYSNTFINCEMQEVVDLTNVSVETSKSTQSNNIIEASGETTHKVVNFNFNFNDNDGSQIVKDNPKVKKEKTGKEQIKVEWDNLRLEAEVKQKRERTPDTMDSLDYEAVRAANVDDVAESIKERGMNNRLAARIKDMLDRLVEDHGSINLEWLRDVPPDKAKEYLLSFKGLGLKSVECIRLLTLHHLAFPVDTNVGRIAVRLGWVPLQPLPESLQLHLLELYPIMESIQQYLWPRLCKLDQRTLYELHYQMITFGKVFCTKTKPNCNACPLRGECRHFASAFASARLGLPAPEKSANGTGQNAVGMIDQPSTSINRTAQSPVRMIDLPPACNQLQQLSESQNSNSVIKETETTGPIVELPATPGPIIEVPASPEPIIEVPATPEPEQINQELDIEDFYEDPEEIPMIKLNVEQFTQNLQTFMESHMELREGDMSKALVALTSEAASIPTPKLKNVSQLRTEHQVYELPDSHPLLEGMDTREPDDPCSYLLAIWTPGETADSIQPPEGQCCSQESGMLCNKETCFFCNSTREANSQTVRGTLLIPCRTAMRGSFPLNGTYFQVNEVFADHASSLNPIAVPRSWLWNLPRRTVYFGTSIPTIFKGMTTEAIQYCFWRGFVCVRGFEQKTRAPRPLMARLHFPISHLKRYKAMADEKEKSKQ